MFGNERGGDRPKAAAAHRCDPGVPLNGSTGEVEHPDLFVSVAVIRVGEPGPRRTREGVDTVEPRENGLAGPEFQPRGIGRRRRLCSRRLGSGLGD